MSGYAWPGLPMAGVALDALTVTAAAWVFTNETADLTLKQLQEKMGWGDSEFFNGMMQAVDHELIYVTDKSAVRYAKHGYVVPAPKGILLLGQFAGFAAKGYRVVES